MQTTAAIRDAMKLVCTAVDEDFALDPSVVLGQNVNQTILEQCLTNGNKDGAAKCLAELRAGRGYGHHVLRQDCLDDENAER
ncbi:hypothetical protein E4U43_001468 [Claviceps pusilla]|uniref:Uncharacterized protein n=1 Tax=Claviceps pusilla TaxID=123648 RepID=A0A9P7SWT6_9HYPO|nr:hypothetical protein E4U43_001468 [Claviceps pusilla]